MDRNITFEYSDIGQGDYTLSFLMKSLFTSLKIPSPLQQICFKGQKILIKRDDLIHPLISGNKWRKLEKNMKLAKDCNYRHLISYGGAFSNHLRALAHAARILDIPSIGIIRGDGMDPNNPTLNGIYEDGMILHFVSRTEYRKKEASAHFQIKL